MDNCNLLLIGKSLLTAACCIDDDGAPSPLQTVLLDISTFSVSGGGLRRARLP
jgi:hypothetical protein